MTFGSTINCNPLFTVHTFKDDLASVFSVYLCQLPHFPKEPHRKKFIYYLKQNPFQEKTIITCRKKIIKPRHGSAHL
jgi:hypothetical protein